MAKILPLAQIKGMNNLRFITPVPVGASIRDVMSLKAVTEKDGGKILMTMGHVVEIQDASRPACVLESLRLFMPGGVR